MTVKSWAISEAFKASAENTISPKIIIRDGFKEIFAFVSLEITSGDGN